MSISPYDNLPTGKGEEPNDGLHYVDVEIIEEAPEEAVPAMKPQEETPPQEIKPSFVATPAPLQSAPPTPQPPTFAKTIPFEKAPHYSSLSVKNLWDTGEYILPFEESLLVPDTMPDMERLLFAEGSVRLAQPQKQSYSKDDFLAGDLTVFAIYQPVSENRSPVDVVKSIIPFKTDKCWGNTENAHFKADASVKSISAEMINERKFVVRGELLIKRTEILQKDVRIFEGTDDADFVQANRSIQITDLNYEMHETTDISQDINIKESQPAPLKILKESICILENHRQITSGKLVINASIHSQVLYLGEEDGKSKLCCLTNKTDFTQFVLVKETADASLINITFASEDLKISIENQNLFLLKGTVSTSICGYKSRKLNMICDAYHKTRDISFDAPSQELSCIKDSLSGEISAREVIEIPESSQKPATLLCGNGQISSIEAHLERGRIIIEGSVLVKILALDEENKPLLIDASLPLRGSLETNVSGNDFKVCTDAALKELWFDEINSRQLEINVTVTIRACVWGRENFITLENLCFAETSAPWQRISMAVYVTGRNDTLWDIAKRYKGDTNAIAELNQLDPQKPLAEGMKLFICS